jgi:hypothetical protein
MKTQQQQLQPLLVVQQVRQPQGVLIQKKHLLSAQRQRVKHRRWRMRSLRNP